MMSVPSITWRQRMQIGIVLPISQDEFAAVELYRSGVTA
jgi:hypothetical protein